MPAKKKKKTPSNQNKTQQTTVEPTAFIDTVKSEVKRKDAHELAALMKKVTGEPPKMWGPTIVGFDARQAQGDQGLPLYQQAR